MTKAFLRFETRNSSVVQSKNPVTVLQYASYDPEAKIDFYIKLYEINIRNTVVYRYVSFF
jgi:hypothetical protein